MQRRSPSSSDDAGPCAEGAASSWRRCARVIVAATLGLASFGSWSQVVWYSDGSRLYQANVSSHLVERTLQKPTTAISAAEAGALWVVTSGGRLQRIAANGGVDRDYDAAPFRSATFAGAPLNGAVVAADARDGSVWIAFRGACSEAPAHVEGALEDLLRDPRFPGVKRHLRQVPADPLTGRAEWGLQRSPDGQILGIYSLAPGVPIKRTGFDPELGALANAPSYQAWVFGTRALAPTPAPSNPPRR